MPRYSQATAPVADDTIDCYTIREFCERHRVGVAMYYNLQKLGLGPETIRLGGKVLITKESAARWRKAREAQGVDKIN